MIRSTHSARIARGVSSRPLSSPPSYHSLSSEVVKSPAPQWVVVFRQQALLYLRAEDKVFRDAYRQEPSEPAADVVRTPSASTGVPEPRKSYCIVGDRVFDKKPPDALAAHRVSFGENAWSARGVKVNRHERVVHDVEQYSVLRVAHTDVDIWYVDECCDAVNAVKGVLNYMDDTRSSGQSSDGGRVVFFRSPSPPPLPPPPRVPDVGYVITPSGVVEKRVPTTEERATFSCSKSRGESRVRIGVGITTIWHSPEISPPRATKMVSSFEIALSARGASVDPIEVEGE